MRMQKRKFRIGEFAKTLNLERFVIRFWEKEFNLKTDRSHGGQRFYSEDDLAMFTEIKDLLYQKGFTIAGAKKQIMDNGSFAGTVANATANTVVGSKKTALAPENDLNHELAHTLAKQQKALEQQKATLNVKLRALQTQLEKLKNVL